MSNNLKEKIKPKLYLAATKYSFLINNKILISFAKNDKHITYKIIFEKTNFLHLTGVGSTLSSLDFYNVCVQRKLRNKDFTCYPYNNNVSFALRKLKHLIKINAYFYNDNLFLQEDFHKGKVYCDIVTTNKKCIIGFVKIKKVLRPKTILSGNYIDPRKPLYRIKVKISN